MKKPKKDTIIVIGILAMAFLFYFIRFAIKKVMDYDLRKYITSNYNVELAKKSTVNHCYANCDYYGFYALADDLTYMIQISKTGSSYKISYSSYDVAIRKELYDYISNQKGDRFVSNYLVFHENGQNSGPVRKSSFKSDRESLKYIVYYDDTTDLENEIYTDYLIFDKARSLTKKISYIDVYYINDSRLKSNRWLERLGIEVNDYVYAPSFLDGDNELYTEKFTYHYSIKNYLENIELDNISFDEYKDLAMKNLEKKG